MLAWYLGSFSLCLFRLILCFCWFFFILSLVVALFRLAVKSQTVHFFPSCVIWFRLNRIQCFLRSLQWMDTTLTNSFSFFFFFFLCCTTIRRLHRVVCGRIRKLNELYLRFGCIVSKTQQRHFRNECMAFFLVFLTKKSRKKEYFLIEMSSFICRWKYWIFFFFLAKHTTIIFSLAWVCCVSM